MQKLIIIISVFISVLFSVNNVFAATCAEEVLDLPNYSRAHDKVVMLNNSGAEFSAARVQAWNEYFGYDIEQECIDIMTVETYQGESGKVYVELTTNDDPCDGGNTYGIILDLNNQVVGEISDSEYYCPAE